MRALTILAFVTLLAAVMPAQAKDSDDLSSWSLEELCAKKDKSRHAEAIFAELGLRNVFSSFDLDLVRSGEIEVGMDAAALQCSWGAPHSVQQGDGAVSQTYYKRIDGWRRTVHVFVVAERVTEHHIRPVGSSANLDPWETFSGRPIDHPHSGPYCSATSRYC